VRCLLVNQKFKGDNSIDASPDIHIIIHGSPDGCILLQSYILFYSRPRLAKTKAVITKKSSYCYSSRWLYHDTNSDSKAVHKTFRKFNQNWNLTTFLYRRRNKVIRIVRPNLEIPGIVLAQKVEKAPARSLFSFAINTLLWYGWSDLQSNLSQALL
jgi:hypothetical protein